MRQFKRVEISGDDFDITLTVKKPEIVELMKRYTDEQLQYTINQFINGFAQTLVNADENTDILVKEGPLVTYFAGPMEFVRGQGAGWRTRLTHDCDKRGIEVRNPCKIEVEDTGLSLQENTNLLKQAKRERDWNLLRKIMDPTQDRDYQAVEESDFVIAYLDHSAGPGGTYCEIEHCKELGIPVYGVCTKDYSNENSWILDTILRTGGKLFSSFEDLWKFIDETYIGE